MEEGTFRTQAAGGGLSLRNTSRKGASGDIARPPFPASQPGLASESVWTMPASNLPRLGQFPIL